MCYAVGGIVDGVGCPREGVEHVELVLVFSLDVVGVDVDEVLPVCSGVVVSCSWQGTVIKNIKK